MWRDIKFFSSILLLLLLLLQLKDGAAQGSCQQNTYFDVPGAQPLSNASAVVTSNNCQTACLSSPNCNGFTQQNGNCNLNVGNPNDIDYTSSNVYSAIIRNTNNCNTAQSCLYTWQGIKNQNGQGGQQNAMTTINDCIKSCQLSDSCTALDWDVIYKNCWLFSSTSVNVGYTIGCYHYSKNCARLPSTLPGLPTTPSSGLMLSTTTTKLSTTLSTASTIRTTSSSTPTLLTAPSRSSSAITITSSSTASSNASWSKSTYESPNTSCSSAFKIATIVLGILLGLSLVLNLIFIINCVKQKNRKQQDVYEMTKTNNNDPQPNSYEHLRTHGRSNEGEPIQHSAVGTPVNDPVYDSVIKGS